MGGAEARISVLDSVVLSSIMIYVWTESAMWSNSLWVNETDTLSYAEHGIPGFGYGYGGFVFSLHILLEIFGDKDHIFRGFSLISSLITMILLYFMSKGIFGRGSGIVSAFIFIWSGYSIEFGMQVREYAVHTMILTGILYWTLKEIEGDTDLAGGEKIGKSPLLICFGVWFVSDHWFSQFFLLMMFVSVLVSLISKGGEKNILSRIPKKIMPPSITLICTLLLESVNILRALLSSSKGEHHLGGGIVPLTILEPAVFLERITSGSSAILLLLAISVFIQSYAMKFNDLNIRDVALGGILFSSLLMGVALSVAQYNLHGLIIERYFYFWFPVICLFCGLASRSIHDMVVSYTNNNIFGFVSLLIVILLIGFTSNIKPDASPYGDMKSGFEKIDSEVGDEGFSIISRPPEHILRYYINQFDLSPDIVVGAWHDEELNHSQIQSIDSDIVVVISLQSSWILDVTENMLEESGYVRDEGATFSSSGDTIWVWRKVM